MNLVEPSLLKVAAASLKAVARVAVARVAEVAKEVAAKVAGPRHLHHPHLLETAALIGRIATNLH